MLSDDANEISNEAYQLAIEIMASPADLSEKLAELKMQ